MLLPVKARFNYRWPEHRGFHGVSRQIKAFNAIKLRCSLRR